MYEKPMVSELSKGEEKKQGLVGLGLLEMGTNLENLHKLLDKLYGKLKPIMMERPEKDSASSEPTPTLPEVVEYIKRHNDTIIFAEKRIKEMISQIEL